MRKRRLELVLGLWLLLIFGTSCTVVFREDFVRIARSVLIVPALGDAFEAFWDSGGSLLVVKGYHVTEFAVLFLLLRSVGLQTTRIGVPSANYLAASLALFYAVSDEWHQTFVPGRGGVAYDVAIDAAGILLGWSICCRRSRPARESSYRHPPA